LARAGANPVFIAITSTGSSPMPLSRKLPSAAVLSADPRVASARKSSPIISLRSPTIGIVMEGIGETPTSASATGSPAPSTTTPLTDLPRAASSGTRDSSPARSSTSVVAARNPRAVAVTV
jgi:hypothetical protein